MIAAASTAGTGRLWARHSGRAPLIAFTTEEIAFQVAASDGADKGVCVA